MRGRQAEARRNDLKLLEAAQEVFTTQGFDAPVSAIAKRAGVGMGSLYRRYRTKEELLQRLAVISMERAAEAAEEGLREPDPWLGLAGYIRACVGFGSGSLAPVAGTIEVTEEMWQVSDRAGTVIGALIGRAQEAGALRADITDLDIALLIERFARPVAGDTHLRERLLTVVLDGLRGPGVTPLPGPPPDREWYESRWGERLP
ncbi:TetR/AcrR family transcriptional regulator [Nonomuraea typhae]|uniref:TetR/AcrR family transcriptional regulator n=1 Tax=Nonomuraea typhae TaxID=2603600 RepID=UPI0012FAC6D1|nr:TetR/AcrR family transcriptional regulator [Nonomuraea typhae]